ncbi:MAG: hypothetical protein WA918_04715 [Erythrobacter sp.]
MSKTFTDWSEDVLIEAATLIQKRSDNGIVNPSVNVMDVLPTAPTPHSSWIQEVTPFLQRKEFIQTAGNERDSEVTGFGYAKVDEILKSRQSRKFVGRLKSIPFSTWIALAGLPISLIALLRAG